LKAGKLDDVLFALDGQTFTGDDKPKAAALLGDAAKAAVQKKDELLALQFAQMALKLDPKQPAALEAAARTSLSQQQFDAAEKYCDSWIEVEPENAQARLLRAQMAVDNADWQIAIDQLATVKLTGADAKKAQLIKAKAKFESSDKSSRAPSPPSRNRSPRRARRERRSPRRELSSNDVILYMTTCGYAARRAFLNARKVFFTEDIEKDPEARRSSRRRRRAGVKQGVPSSTCAESWCQFDQNARRRLAVTS
jgi:tetratricopeptide (TPR) repeat protein